MFRFTNHIFTVDFPSSNAAEIIGKTIITKDNETVMIKGLNVIATLDNCGRAYISDEDEVKLLNELKNFIRDESVEEDLEMLASDIMTQLEIDIEKEYQVRHDSYTVAATLADAKLDRIKAQQGE